MRNGYLALCRMLDRATLIACGAAALVLVVMVLGNVVARYGFGVGSIKTQDLAAYAFAVFLILSLPLTLARGGHVRVEVFSERMPPGYIRSADGVALILFLIPLFALIIAAGWSDMAFMMRIRQGSMTPGGLGGLWLVRLVLPLAAGLMILQGIAALMDPPKPAEGHTESPGS